MVPDSKLVYANIINAPIDFAISPNNKHIITLGSNFIAKITDMETMEDLGKIFKFNGLRLILPSCFDFPNHPTIVSVNSR
jgi:hypothetical protein